MSILAPIIALSRHIDYSNMQRTRRAPPFASTRRPLIAATFAATPSQIKEASFHADPYLNYDVSTREARERLVSPPALGRARAKATPTQRRDPVESSVRLSRLRPSHGSVAVLCTLLKAHADANIVPGPGDMLRINERRA